MRGTRVWQVAIGVPGTVVERVDLVPEGGGGQHVLVVCVRVGFGGQGRCSRCRRRSPGMTVAMVDGAGAAWTTA